MKDKYLYVPKSAGLRAIEFDGTYGCAERICKFFGVTIDSYKLKDSKVAVRFDIGMQYITLKATDFFCSYDDSFVFFKADAITFRNAFKKVYTK